MENVFSLFLSSFRNTSESLGELKKALEALDCGSCSHSIPRSPKLAIHSCFYITRSIQKHWTCFLFLNFEVFYRVYRQTQKETYN